MLVPRVQFILLSLLWSLALAVAANPDFLDSKWESVVPNDGIETKPLWLQTKRNDIIGIAISDRFLWTFRFKKDLFKKWGTLNESPVFYRESKVFKEEILGPLFPADKWALHHGTFRAAIILSYGNSEPTSKGFITAFAQEIMDRTGVREVQWKPTVDNRETDMTLTKLGGHEAGGSFLVSRGNAAFFRATFTENDQWNRDTLSRANLKTPNFNDRSANSLAKAQQLYTEESIDRKVEMPYDKAHKYEISAEMILYEWPGGKSRENPMERTVYRHDGNENPVDIFIIVATVANAWVLMLPKKLVEDAEEALKQRGRNSGIRASDWFHVHIRGPILDRWKVAIRSFDEDGFPLLQGKLVGISVLSRNDHRNQHEFRNERLIRAILEELWDESTRTKEELGPLQGQPTLHIPYLSFKGSERLTPGSGNQPAFNRMMAPKYYFVAESMSLLELVGPGVEGKQGTSVRMFYGGRLVFYSSFARCHENDPPEEGVDYLPPRNSEMTGEFTFTPSATV